MKITAGVPTNLISGLDYVAGITTNFPILSGGDYSPFADAIQVGNVDGSFVPSIKQLHPRRHSAHEHERWALSGALDHASSYGGNIIVTGGFTDDFMSSTLVQVVQAGAVDEIASGWASRAASSVRPSERARPGARFRCRLRRHDPGRPLHDARREGSRNAEVEQWGGQFDPSKGTALIGLPRWTCTDGDPACDRDLTVNGSCSYTVGTCVRLLDELRGFTCTPVDVDTVTITSKKIPAAASAMQTAVNAILPATVASCSESTRRHRPGRPPHPLDHVRRARGREAARQGHAQAALPAVGEGGHHARTRSRDPRSLATIGCLLRSSRSPRAGRDLPGWLTRASTTS